MSVLNLTFYKIVFAVRHDKTPTFWTPKFHSDDVNLSIICLVLPFKGLKDQIYKALNPSTNTPSLVIYLLFKNYFRFSGTNLE